MKSLKPLTIAVVALSCGVLAASASADPIVAIIDFSTGSAGFRVTPCPAGGGAGCISFSGIAGDPLVGQKVRIGLVGGIDTPANNEEYRDVTGNATSYGVLDFQTGAYLGYAQDAYHFAGGGFFTIYGNIVDIPNGINIHSATGDGALLSSGTFVGASVENLGSTSFFSASGSDTIHPDLVDYFGLAATTPFVFPSFSIDSGMVGTGGGFSTKAFSTDVSNTVSNAALAVPEPVSLLLFGSGLTIVGSVLRRRRVTVGREPHVPASSDAAVFAGGLMLGPGRPAAGHRRSAI